MPYVFALLLSASVVGLLYVWRASRKLEHPNSRSSAAIAESLVWCDGDLSPNGRRVLLMESAAASFVSATSGSDGAAYFAAGCPVDAEALATKLPDDPVKEKVSWHLTAEERQRVRDGFVPEVMEDKWRIVTVPVDGGERVFLLRSWTGAVMYVLDLGEHNIRWVWRGARDAIGVAMARAIVDGYLLGRPCVVPAPRELGEDKQRLMVWGFQMAGRRCKAVEPHVTA